jgi:hypothetical protein
MLKREIQNQLSDWKSQRKRLPLLLKGARQVGKSTALQAFGERHFRKAHVVNFQQQKGLRSLFEGDLSPQKLLRDLGIALNTTVVPNQDFLFLDEIQDCPPAITSLKYFSEQMPELAVACAGSYLGLIDNQISFPVGKVHVLNLAPLCFSEFLENFAPELHEIYRDLSLDQSKFTPPNEFYHHRFLEWFQRYIVTGGLPAALEAFQNTGGKENELPALKAARKIQRDLITGYQSDFSKHSGTVNASHILYVFQSIAEQLAQYHDETVRKFQFTGVIPNQKGFERIRSPLSWLSESRLAIKCSITSKAKLPLGSSKKGNRFKLFLFDVGILNAMLGIPVEALLSNSLGSYKGFIAENFVAQELYGKEDLNELYSLKEGQSEIEFLISRKAHLLPVEVKSSTRTRRSKSLDAFISRYDPPIAYKLSPQRGGLNSEKNILTCPIYFAGKL